MIKPRSRYRYRADSTRLKGWDYTSHALYLVTICTKFRAQWFGHVDQGSMVLSPIGEQARKCWTDIPNHHKHVVLDTFVIMPDHLHGIVLVRDRFGSFSAETRHGSATLTTSAAPLLKRIASRKDQFVTTRIFGPLQRGSLSIVINHFKGAVTRWCNANGYGDFQWQERFRDDRIRTEHEMQKVRHYIVQNPKKWEERYGSELPWSYSRCL